MFKMAEYILDHKEITVTQVPTIKNHGGEDPAYKHVRNIPTSRAIDILAQEWRDRPPVYPHVRKEVYWPDTMEKSAQQANPYYFIAVVPSAEAKQSIPSFRNPDDLHVTLAYLGPKSMEEIEAIKLKLYEITKDSPSFNMESMGYYSFGGRYPHLRMKTSPELLSLHDRIHDNIEYNLQFKKFVPHMTVNPRSTFVPKGDLVEFDVKSIVLYRGDRGGYTPVAQFPLKDESIIDKIKSWFRNVI